MVIGTIIRGMILNINLMQNYSDNSVTANSSSLSPTVSVNSIPPIHQNPTLALSICVAKLLESTFPSRGGQCWDFLWVFFACA